MLKSLYSGVTGMRSQQTKMDVISNNIANVSTTGFKAGRVRFQDLISQIDSPAQGSTNNLGGVNPRQIGMGVQVSGTDTIMTAGSLQTTGRSMDFGIQDGDNSFFTVRAGDDGNTQYTRDGAFFTDHKGTLVTSSGYQVLGYAGAPLNMKGEDGKDIDITKGIEDLVKNADGNTGELKIHKELWAKVDIDGKIIAGDDAEVSSVEQTNIFDPDAPVANTYKKLELDSYNIDNTGTITGNYGDDNNFILGRMALTSFVNPDGLEKAGGNLYNSTPNSGNANLGAPTDKGFGQIRTGFLEMSNVDLANEFTEMIVTNRAYQANSRSITTSDEMIQELINLKR